MDPQYSRRCFMGRAAGAAVSGSLLFGQPLPKARAQDDPVSNPSGSRPIGGVADQRRKPSRNVCQSLVEIEDQLLPLLKSKKHVVIKPNMVSTHRQIASTNVDTLHGILDFLGPRFNGPVVIAESSAGYTTEGFDNFGYHQVISEHKPLEVSLVDLNEEGLYKTHTILNGDLHAVPVRLAARLLDPDAFIICSAMLKTHNTVVATMSVKNMASGRAATHAQKEKQTLERQTALPRWGAADSCGHHAHCPAAAAVLGRDGHRWLRGDGRQWARPVARRCRHESRSALPTMSRLTGLASKRWVSTHPGSDICNSADKPV